MGITKERRAKLDRLLQFLRRGGKWLSLAAVSLLGAIFLGDREHWPIVAVLAVIGLLLSLIGWLVEENRNLKERLNYLGEELVRIRFPSSATEQMDEPTEVAYSILCMAVDGHPAKVYEASEFAERFGLDDDDVEEALEHLTKLGYLEEPDHGMYSEYGNPHPDGYKTTREGRQYVKQRRAK